VAKEEDTFCILGGYYSLEDIARLLLLAADGSDVRAGRALRVAIKKGAFAKLKHSASDDMMFLAARKIQLQLRAKRKRCSDFTAIRTVAGRSWRTLYREYQQRGQSLKQIARLYADSISDKTTPTF
jgi:hypothetical protein